MKYFACLLLSLFPLAAGCSNSGGGGGPRADFSAAPTSGAPPLQVQFQESSVGAFDAWLWDFGDGSTSTERKPVHVYAAVGSYTVQLTVSGPDGTHRKTAIDLIRVQSANPSCLEGSWSVSASFLSDECTVPTGLEDVVFELESCDTCGGEAYRIEAPIEDGALGAVVIPQSPNFPSFAITGCYYSAAVDRTFDLSLGIGDSGEADCDQFTSTVSCLVYLGDAILLTDDGFEIDPEATLECEGSIEFLGSREVPGSFAESALHIVVCGAGDELRPDRPPQAAEVLLLRDGAESSLSLRVLLGEDEPVDPALLSALQGILDELGPSLD